MSEETVNNSDPSCNLDNGSDSNVYCQNCDIRMNVLKSGYKIHAIKQLMKFECTPDDNEDKIIECMEVELCSCPECDFSGLVDLGENWLSKKELQAAIKEKRIFSENAELNVIFRLLA